MTASNMPVYRGENLRAVAREEREVRVERIEVESDPNYGELFRVTTE